MLALLRVWASVAIRLALAPQVGLATAQLPPGGALTVSLHPWPVALPPSSNCADASDLGLHPVLRRKLFHDP